MQEKKGRERQFLFDDAVFTSNEGRWMFGMLMEVGRRVLDQVEHLPAEVLHAAPAGSYLKPARIILHLVGNDLKRFPSFTGPFAAPDYAADAQKTAATDLTTMETAGIDVVGVLRRHVAFRESILRERCGTAGLLDQPIDDPNLATKRDAVGHLIWHWSFHGGHIGAVTLEMGHEYIWTSAKRS